MQSLQLQQKHMYSCKVDIKKNKSSGSIKALRNLKSEHNAQTTMQMQLMSSKNFEIKPELMF